MNPDRWDEWAGNTGWNPALRGSEMSPLTGLLNSLRRRYYNYFAPNGAGMNRTAIPQLRQERNLCSNAIRKISFPSSVRSGIFRP